MSADLCRYYELLARRTLPEFSPTISDGNGGPLFSAEDIKKIRNDAQSLGELNPEELREFQHLQFRFESCRVDQLRMGCGNTLTIYNTHCRAIPGSTPRVCPRAIPSIPNELMPEIEGRFRSLHLVKDNQSALWVGDQATPKSLCMWRDDGAKCDCFALVPADTIDHRDAEQPPNNDSVEQYVTLDQMAAIVNRNKKTLERYLNHKDTSKRMPQPDVEGGGGQPHEWRWSRVRSWLHSTFGKTMPEQFPSSRIVG